MENTKPRKKLTTFVLLMAIVLLALLGYYLWKNGLTLGPLSGSPSYQAVFLSNGQVYFGKASNINSNYLDLKDVYYLQVSEVLQPVQGKTQPEPRQSISLAKLGASELHKPKDAMKINRDQVLFIEDLESDSQVVQAIIKYKEDQLKAL